METVVSSPINTVVTNIDTSNNVVSAAINTEYVTQNTISSVLVDSINTNVLVTGLIGPPGPTAANEEDIMYSKRIDFISDDEFYRGEAVVGSSENNAVWRIRHVTIINNDVTELWAGGTANFDKVWANRLSLSYI